MVCVNKLVIPIIFWKKTYKYPSSQPSPARGEGVKTKLEKEQSFDRERTEFPLLMRRELG